MSLSNLTADQQKWNPLLLPNGIAGSKNRAPFAELFSQYETWLFQQGLSKHTKRYYRSCVSNFLQFIAAQRHDMDAFLNRLILHSMVVQYKEHLLWDLKAKPGTINVSLAAIDNFFAFSNMRPAGVKRQNIPGRAPRVLDTEEQDRFLTAIRQDDSAKRRAVAMLLFYGGMKIIECVRANIEDVEFSGRLAKIVVDGRLSSQSRTAPLNFAASKALYEWLLERQILFKDTLDPALFLNQQGARLTSQAIDSMVRHIGHRVRLDVSAHVLRHTCLGNLVRNGADPALLREIGGFKNFNRVMRYIESVRNESLDFEIR